MTNTQIIIALGAFAVIISFIAYYVYIRNILYKQVNGIISDTEDSEKKGEEKLAEATERLYNLIPLILKPFLSKEVVKDMVQFAFNRIEEYAKKQVEKKNKNH